MLPEALQALTHDGSLMLLEVACSPDSVLSATMQDMTKDPQSAHRCSRWNQCDLGTSAGVKNVLDQITLKKPKLVWLSPVCGPYSVMQNINQRSEQQKQELETKRRDALEQYVGCSIIFRFCVQHGIHAAWEWSQSCHAWRLPLIQKLCKDYDPYFAIIRGCRVDLKDDVGNYISKGWKVMTTHELLARRLSLPCQCEPHVKHVPCEGKLTNRTAYYTRKLAQRVCQAIIQGSDRQTIQRELEGHFNQPNEFGMGLVCQCHEGNRHGAQIKCGFCTHQQTSNLFGFSGEHSESFVAVGKKDLEQVRKKLYLLHSATGHGDPKHLYRALKLRGAPEHVLHEAKNFQCPICQERSKPQPRNRSSLEPQPARFSTVAADIGHWVHPKSGEHFQFILMIDEGSRFRVCRHVLTGKQKHVSAAQFISSFREAWTEYFGFPETLRLDPDGAFRSHEISTFCDQHQLFLDMIPGEVHWKLGICEQAIQGVKEVLNKLADEQEDSSFPDLLAETCRAFNVRETIRGYSPFQHVLGQAPDETGRFFQSLRQAPPEPSLGVSTVEMQRQRQVRLSAEKAFLEWQSVQRLQRASNSQHKRVRNFEVGDLVYIWRKQLPHKGAGQKPGKGQFIGPARILATEQSRDPEGNLRRHSSVWLVRGRRLIKCSVEQLRAASSREVLMEELYQPEDVPWDFPRVASELGGNDYDDMTEQNIDDQEWQRAQDPQEEQQPRYRHWHKQPERGAPSSSQRDREVHRERSPLRAHRTQERDLEEEMDAHMEAESQPAMERRTRSRTPRPGSGSEPPMGFAEIEGWCRLVDEAYFTAPTSDPFWNDPDTAVSVEIDLPHTRASSERALKNMVGYFTTAMKKRAVEVNERKLTAADKAKFAAAKDIEVNNFIQARAFEALPEHLRLDKSRAIRMRWILTWKKTDSGEAKVKARAVLLGYQDPLYEHRATTSPTTTRQTRQVQLQISASMRFRTWKGDVTGAFLQSRPYPSELLCIPCPEICTAMGIPAESVVRVKKACDGLVDAPLEWYRSVCEFFSHLGFRRCWSDPCCWTLVKDGVLRGLISAHVDDFLFSGSESDEVWLAAMTAIKEQFKWSDWQRDQFVQCGVLIEQHADFSFSLSQESYVDELKHINIRAHRRKEKHASTDQFEKSLLRTLLGGLSWHAQQVAPHISAEVGMLLSEVNHSTVETLYKANKCLDQAKGMKQHRMRIHAMPVNETILCAWTDAAAHNRVDGSSTQGIIVAAAPEGLLQGRCENISFLTWHSSKIGRICRSPGASEAIAAVNAEDLLFFARLQFVELLGHTIDIRQVNKSVNLIRGCLVTDSRNVFDKLATEAVCTRGAEKRVDLDLMSLKDAQLRNQVIVRWVHSDAQIANSLTKGKELHQLHLFYEMNQRWRVVDDETMSSARKRKEKGLKPLDNHHPLPESHSSEHTSNHSTHNSNEDKS